MLMRMSRGLVRENKRATKRDAYYVGKGDDWGEAQFEEQPESDAIIDDIEAMFAAQGVTREQLRFVADTHGGSVAGELMIVDRHPKTGEEIVIDCTRMGTGSYTIRRSSSTCGSRRRRSSSSASRRTASSTG